MTQPETSNPQAATDAAPSWKLLFVDGNFPRLAILCLGVWLHAADATLVATVMPVAVDEIGGVPFISWTIALYELASIIAGAATGMLVVRFSLRGAMVAAALVYALGCVASAVAPDMAVMLIGRSLQGLGGGGLVAASYVAIGQLFPEALWPRVMAAVSGVWGASAFCGPLIGGFFASIGLWRMGFWAFAAQAAVLAVAVMILVALPRKGESQDEAATFVPVGRLALLAAGILAIAVAGSGVSIASATAYSLAGAGLLWLFLQRDGKARHSLFPRRPLSLDHWVGAGTVTVLAFATTTVSFFTYGPLLMKVLYGADPLTAGYIVTVESIAWTVAALAFASASMRSEPLIIRAGSVAITLSVIGLAVTMPNGPLYALLPWVVLAGAGFGMCWGFIVRRVVSSALEAEREKAASGLPTMQLIGYAVGAALTGIVANTAGFADGVTRADAEVVGFWVFAAFLPLALLGNLAAWRLTREPNRRQPSLEAA